MSTQGTLSTLSEKLREHPGSTTSYLAIALFISTFTLIAFIGAALAGHIVFTTIVSHLSFNTLVSSILSLGVAFLTAAVIWTIPYVLSWLMTRPFTVRPQYIDLPRYEMWGIWMGLPAIGVFTILWFSSLIAGVLPGVAATIGTLTPAGLPNNLLSFAVVAFPMPIVYTLLVQEDMRDDPSRSHTTITESDTSSTSPPEPRQSTSQETPTKSPTEQPTAQPNAQSATQSASTNTSKTPFSEYTYSWQDPPTTTFRDVGGMDSVKEDLLREIIKPLSGNIEKYREFGVSIPNLLFYGPPGTGKTFMAEALAGELNYPYVKLSASDVTSKWINESGDNINTLFREAERIGEEHGYAIVFIDEIDALLSDRGMGQQHSENKKVVDEFLNHLSETSDRNTLFIGATNHFDSLDSAAVRTGRIDKKVHIGMPDVDARRAVLAAQLQSRPGSVPPAEKLEILAQQLDGCSCADIKGVVDRAARRAVERNASGIELEDLVATIQQSA